MSAINKFLTWLNEEIGYLEKKNNDQIIYLIRRQMLERQTLQNMPILQILNIPM